MCSVAAAGCGDDDDGDTGGSADVTTPTGGIGRHDGSEAPSAGTQAPTDAAEEPAETAGEEPTDTAEEGTPATMGQPVAADESLEPVTVGFHNLEVARRHCLEIRHGSRRASGTSTRSSSDPGSPIEIESCTST